ncbi:MAG TPA: MFS transporter [Bryobacteraceae bacterium]|nr:MFS transporter [Bryobacteraceae bacterium]
MTRRWVVVALIFFGIVISYVDRGNLGIAAPSMMREFGFQPASMGLLLSAFFWTYGLFQIPAGTAVDRFGIRTLYAVAFGLWSIASAAIGFSRGLTDILLLRLLLGVAEAVGPIASLSFIRRNFSGAELGLPTAIYIAGQNFGPAAGTLLGTHLIVQFGWRAMFIFTGLGALVWLPIWLWLAPRDDARAKTETNPSIPLRGIPWREVLAMRGFWATSLCIFLSSYFWYFLLTWVPTYLTSTRGFSTTEMGRVLSVPLFTMAVINIAGGTLADRLVKRLGSVFRVRLWFCAAGYLGSGSVLLLLVLPGREAVLPILVFAVCAAGIGNSNYWALSQQAAPANLVGRTIGYLNTISQLAGAAAPLITGWILGPQKQFEVALAIAGVAPVLAAACLLFTGVGGLERMKASLAQGSTLPLKSATPE